MRPKRDKSAKSTPALRIFGSQVRRFRDLRGLSQDALGVRIHVTGSFVGAVERGESRCTRELAVVLDNELDARGTLPSLWDDLVMNAVFPTWFDWPTVEGDSIMIQSYQPLVVHGLLQSPSYALTILRGSEEAANARIARQSILTREDPPPPIFSVLLDEAVLTRQVGSPEVMREQLEYLLEMAEHENIQLQIVPTNGEHLGHYGAFTLATLPDMSEVAYIETVARGFTMGDPEDLAIMTRAIMEVRSHALPVNMSLELIRRTVKEKWT